MSEQIRAGFSERKTPLDGWVAGLLEKHNLPAEASLEDIEPIAIELWSDPRTRLDATELVLGRRVDSSEFEEDPLLDGIILIPDPAEAFGNLLMLRAAEEYRANRSSDR